MTAMNQNQLRAIFHYLKVPASAYDLGNNMRLGACETIEHTSQGWEVYATERGSKCAVKVFSNETDACYNLLYRMTHYCDIDKTLPNLTIRKLHSILLAALAGLPLGVLNANDTAQHTAVFRCAAQESVLFSPHCVCLQPWRTLSAKCFSENRISVIAYNLINTDLL